MRRLSWDRVNPWRGLAAMPREVWVLFTATLVNKAGSMVLAFLVLYLTRDLGFTAGQAGAVLFVYGLGALVAAALSGRLSDVLGPMVVIRNSLFANGKARRITPERSSDPRMMLIGP